MAFAGKMIPAPTDRLFFRHFKPDDLEQVFEINKDPRVMKYFPEIKNDDEITIDFRRYLKYHHERPGYGYWHTSLNKTSAFVGFFVVKILPETGETEIGYRLLPEFWGKGLATEGALAMVEYSFRTLKATRLVGVANPENVASCRVLEKAGLNFVKIDRFYQVQCSYYVLEKA